MMFQMDLAFLMAAMWNGLSGVVVAVFLSNLFVPEKNLPHIMKAAIRHGKLIQKNFIAVPKSFFTHFYLAGIIVNTTVTMMLLVSLRDEPKSNAYIGFLLTYIDDNKAAIDCSSAILVIFLMTLQNARRLYESFFITVFSSGKMSVLHYFLGHLMYCTFHLSVLSQTRFTSREQPGMKKYRVAGIVVFFIGSYMQHKVALQLASLRKNKEGVVQHRYDHFVPTGGLFTLVSCPHYLCEIIIFSSYLIITGFQHMVLWTVVIFAVTNQLVSSYVTHEWYNKKFDSYKKMKRKAVIPFIF